MTKEVPVQNAFFPAQDIGARIPQDHLLRQIARTLDLSFVDDAVESTYGVSGHESIPPTRIMKLLLLLVIYNVPSERALFRDLPMRIDWLWFLGFDLSSRLPNHSVLSKARRRWGPEVFHELFARSIQLCMSKGLIDGRDLLADSSLVDANASVDSLFRVADQVARTATARLDQNASDPADDSGSDGSSSGGNERAAAEPKYRSKTDPDATGAKRRGETRVRPRYQTHRAVDSAQGVITATTVGPGHENEANYLEQLVVDHTAHTGQRVRSMTADDKYGTADNLEFCEVNQIEAFIRPFRSNYTRPREGQFTECCFRYDATSDTYICPAGERLTRRGYRPDKDAFKYSAPAKACSHCPVRALCTSGRHRTLSRPARIEILERARSRCRTDRGREHRKLRRWMMEGSFARSVPLGYKRARGRGLASMRIQDYLIAAVQNFLILLKATHRSVANSCSRALQNAHSIFRPLLALNRLRTLLAPDRPLVLAFRCSAR
ncbi:MAG: IS1182 family transposase [Thermoanaerobaculia bacterium]